MRQPYQNPNAERAIFGACLIFQTKKRGPRLANCRIGSVSRQSCHRNKTAQFIGQIAFGDMQGTVLGQELPVLGGFAVFAIIEVMKLGIVETLVRPWNNSAKLTRHRAPQDLIEDKLGDSTNGPYPAHAMELKEVLSLPDAADGPFVDEIPGCKHGEEYRELYGNLLHCCDPGIFGFGGYLRGTSGADPSPDTQSLRFAVLRVTPDAGVIHFSVPTADLKQGRLDRVQYVWNDWDG